MDVQWLLATAETLNPNVTRALRPTTVCNCALLRGWPLTARTLSTGGDGAKRRASGVGQT